MTFCRKRLILLSCLVFVGIVPKDHLSGTQADEPLLETTSTLSAGDTFSATDSLKVAETESGDAAECLQGLRWEPTEFLVTLEQPRRGFGQWLVRFPSPRPQGDAEGDNVALEWYATKNDSGEVQTAPAVVVVHESGRNMAVGRLIARGLAGMGVHAFLIQLPGYGVRGQPIADDPQKFLGALQQAVADVRRARDAIAVLPHVDQERIGLQGTSLGGFVTATVCGLDHSYHRQFIFLAGGNLHEVVLQGQRDAAKVRERLRAAGLSDEQIIALARPVEPLRLAHRVNANITWLYSGIHDDVVPPSCCQAWADAAQLAESHHIQMPVDHYSGVTYLPKILGEIVAIMLASPESWKLPNQP
ncbi:MAG: prolyl oligopeptidase family serine peptidase [Planctomycetaceae bacterium]|nr:prolyl oligopeptidase family serine peptidase [Planctomycetaceae bacterium]